jgi:amino acid transporter
LTTTSTNSTSTVQGGVFTRQSSGLVRQVRTDDVMFYGWQQIALGYIIFIVFAWQFYPGASMETAAIVATIGGVFLAMCYALLTITYPRSGGDYVFMSRILHPSIGFSMSFSMAFWEIFYYGINGAFLSIYGMAPLFSTLGVQEHNTTLLNIGTWFAGHTGTFITGSAMIVIFAFIQHRGVGLYFRTQRWASYVAAVSLVATIITLALTAGHVFHFQANFDRLAGHGAYNNVIQTAKASGANLSPHFSFSQTMNFSLWPAFSLWFAVISVTFAGEIKNVQRGTLIGINGAIVTMGIAMAVLMFLYRAAFGSKFLLAATMVPGSKFPLPASPFVNLFTGIAGGNAVLTVINSLWVILILLYVGGTTLVYSTRSMIAWGIDGVVPDSLADVSEKYHTPTWAIVISLLLAELWLGLYSYTTVLAVLSGYLGFALPFMVAALTALLFPFLRKSTFENSPVAWRVGGIPLISIFGAVALAFTVFLTVRLLQDSDFGANHTFSIVMAVCVFGGSLVWFYVYRAFKQRSGVQIDRRFKEIPVE